MLKKISVGLAVAACLINEFLRGLYAGFSYGASKMCQTVYPTFEVNGAQVWATHLDPYFYLHGVQVYFLFALLIFIIGKLAERGIISQIVSFLPLVFSVFFWLWIESIKSPDINEPNKYVDLLRETVVYSRTMIALISVLIILQIFVVLRSANKKRKTKQIEMPLS